MKALFGGICRICNESFAKNEEINWDPATKKATHAYCFNAGSEPAERIADRLGYRYYSWEELLAGMSQKRKTV